MAKKTKAKKTKAEKDNTPSLPKKNLMFLMNMIESRFFEENLILCDLTPYEIVYQEGNMRVRHYLPLEGIDIMLDGKPIPISSERHRVPVVMIPPLGATAVNFDLFPDRSIVKYLMANGFDVYLIDWGEVGRGQRKQNLEHYISVWFPNALKAIRKDSGKRNLSLIGYCMGGLLSLMYMGHKHDRYVKNIVTVVSPVNWYENGAAGQLIKLINKNAKAVSGVMNVRLSKLPDSVFHIPGWMVALIFKMTDPLGSLKSYYDGMINMWDRDFLIRRKTMEQWFNKMEDYSGGMIKDALTEFMHDNKLAKGKLKLGKGEIDLTAIDTPLLAFAGKTDNLVSIKSAKHLLNLVSSEDKEFHVVPGGHAGAFAGKKSFESTWPITVDWLSTRSD